MKKNSRPKIQSRLFEPQNNINYPVKCEVFAELASELGDALDSELGGVIEVVDDDGGEPFQKELQHGVAPDVTGAARDQDAPPHDRSERSRRRRTRQRVGFWEGREGRRRSGRETWRVGERSRGNREQTIESIEGEMVWVYMCLYTLAVWFGFSRQHETKWNWLLDC